MSVGTKAARFVVTLRLRFTDGKIKAVGEFCERSLGLRSRTSDQNRKYDAGNEGLAEHGAAFLTALPKPGKRFVIRNVWMAGSCCLHLHDEQREAQPQFLLHINLNVVQAELLKLHPAEIMDIRRVAFHLLELKLHLRLRNHLPIVWTDDF